MRLSRFIAAVTALTGVVAAAACGGAPTVVPPPPAAPTVSCPASLSSESADNVPIPVTYSTPTTSGGQAPVSVTCSAASGANFPLGTTVVSCTATDALQRAAACSFSITVTPTPRISKTKFLAFGDSITAGQCGSNVECPPYSAALQTLLQQRYTRQTISMINSGIDGEIASDDIPPCCGNVFAGQDRLPRELGRDFEVLLLMEGTNDLINVPSASGVESAASALDQMVFNARAAGKSVFLATIAPMRFPAPGSGKSLDAAGPFVPQLNERIRSIAISRGATLVDVYAALIGDLANNISSDNLHPTQKGLNVIGDTFYAAIRQVLDSTPAANGAPQSLFSRPARMGEERR